MSNKDGKAKQVHSEVLRCLGEAWVAAALGVARDLRSGVIPPFDYDQSTWGECGTVHCIGGHIALRLGVPQHIITLRVSDWLDAINAARVHKQRLLDLFKGMFVSSPYLAADAIERFIYEDGHVWGV